MTNCQKGKVNQLLYKAGLPVHNAMLFAFMPHLLHFENVAIYIYTAWPNNSQQQKLKKNKQKLLYWIYLVEKAERMTIQEPNSVGPICPQ